MLSFFEKFRRTPADTNNDNASDESGLEQNEALKDTKGDLTYDNEEEEPQFHWRTVVACVAMFMLNFVQVVALEGPPAVVSLKCCIMATLLVG